MPTILGATPANQLNALPLRTATAAAADGDIEVVGGTISRYWSPAVLGVVSANAVASGGAMWLSTVYLNVTGCSRYALFIRRTNALGDAIALTTTTVLSQYRFTKTSTPPLTPAVQGTNAVLSLISSDLGFVAIAAGATQNCIATWSSELNTGSAANARPLVIGSDVRILVSMGGAHLPGVDDFFSLSLWGQT